MNTEILTPRQVLSRYWNNSSIPVNPYKIAKNAGIAVKHLDNDNSLSGRFTPSYEENNIIKQPCIEYNPNESLKRQRFTIAHELGHCFLGHNNNKQHFRDPTQNFSLKNYNNQEVQANKFAADLLMPEDSVNYFFWNKGITNIRELAEIFDVSVIAMELRLEKIGII